MSATVHNHSDAAQVPPSSQRGFLAGLSLQSRFLLIMGTASIFFALLSWAAFNSFTEHLIERIGARLAETQMFYDKARTLQPLINRITPLKRVADAAIIKQWMANEEDAALYLKLHETINDEFRGNSFFIASLKSKHFFYDDPLIRMRYALNPSLKEDAWFFDFIRSGDDQRVRIAQDDQIIGITKIWIMVPIRNGKDAVGVLGVGINLDDFVRNASNTQLPGVANMFINRDAVIQIYNGGNSIVFPSVENADNLLKPFDQIISTSSGKKWVQSAMSVLDRQETGVETEFVRIGNKRYMAGMLALPELGWYDVTLLDMSVLLPHFDFIKMVLIVVISTLLVLAIMAFSLHKMVLRPVATLTDAVSRVRRGDYSTTPLPESSNEVQELAVQFQDMATTIHNTQEWLEAEIENRTRQLSDAQNMLEISLQHEREGRETQANLMAIMAHEMRSPIAVIGNTAQMLKVLSQVDHPDQIPRIEKIMRSVRQLATLMDNFLTEKWLEMDKHGLNLKLGDLNEVCAEVTHSFSDRPGHSIRFEPLRGDARLFADWPLIRIAVSNLLDNACKYSSAGNAVVIKIQLSEDDMLRVEVSNRGANISPEMQSRIFEKFVRGQQHEGSTQGTGLGLYLVNWIAKFHGGRTDVLSTAEQGNNTFCLILPRNGELPPQDSDSTDHLQL
ncbi:MAG: HAMP domain-containing histidine kinase [Gallionellaceae bacterium]|jgi:signal transduction histidine kinase|nr:HAMP domain-containing histidine kinase [Gallionellaceae bacterium]